MGVFPRLAAILAALSAAAFAQSTNASVSGEVTDKSGAVIAGVSITLTSDATGSARTTTTDSDGAFRFNAIQPNIYTLSIEAPGFRRYVRTGVELTANQTLSVGKVALELGQVSESVTVSADIATVQIASGERSGVITSEEIENLTVINRDFSTLVSLLPGVVDNPGSAEVQGFSGGASFNVGGNRSNGNSITIDGGSVENSNGGNGNNFVSMDSIQTVRIVTSNYQAEFGRKPAAAIMAISKGGSKQFHGATYWYYRHEWMNANNFFNNRSGVPQTPRRVQTPGFNLGGPLWKSKLFFFSSLEFIKERRPQDIRNLTVPTELERRGDFTQSFDTNGRQRVVNDPLDGKRPFPGNVIPASRIDPNGAAYLKLLPLPGNVNRAIAGFNYNLQVQESLNIPKMAQTTRIDYILSSKTQLWLKYNYWREDQQGWAVSAGNANWGWMPAHYLNISHAPVLSVTHILSPRTVLEVSARMTRWTEDGSALNESDLERLNRTTAGFNIRQFWPSNNPRNLVPNATFGGITNSANPSYNARFPLRGAETPLFSDAVVTHTRGAHVMKFGFYYERWRAVKGEQGNWAGTFDFSTDTLNPNDANHPYANALLGNFKSYTESNSRPPLYEQTTSLEWFAQDNWKVRRNLTLDVGVRWGWSQPFYSPRRQEAGFVPSRWDPSQVIRLMTPVRVNNTRQAQDPVTGQLYPATVIGAVAPNTGNPYNGTVNLMTDPNYPHGLRENSGIRTAPRFGFSWDPFGSGKTAVRGGIGVFYEIHEKDLFSYALHLDPPNQLSPQIFYSNFSSLASAQGFQFPSNTSGLTPDRTLARTMSYSLGIQRFIGFGTVLDVAYVGTLGRHLFARRNLNSIPAGTTLSPAALDPSNPGQVLPTQYLRPYLGYGDILFYNYDTNSSYHSLQVMANRRFMKHFSGGLAYTWSKAMDYADNESTNLSNLVSPKVWNYGRAGFDRSHILKGNWIYELPKGTRMLPEGARKMRVAQAVLDAWQISGILTMMTGAPTGVTLSLTSGSNTNWSGSPTDGARPNVVGNPNLPASERSFGRNLNSDAFAVPAQGTLGNAAREVFRGPGRNNWDISLFKNFRVTEKIKGQFRGETYNTLNHTQFATMDTTLRFDNRTGAQVNPQFSQYLTAQLARRMQLALRITW